MRNALGRLIEEGWRIGWAEGRAEGWAESLFLTLRQRFGEVPAALADRIGAQQDAAVLDRWLALAIRAPSLQAFARGLEQWPTRGKGGPTRSPSPAR